MQMGHTSKILFCSQPTLITGWHFMSDFSAQVRDLYSNNEFHSAGSLSTEGHMLIPARLLPLPPLSQITTHHHGKHSKCPQRNVRGRHHYNITHTPSDIETHGTMLFISKDDEAAIPQSCELFTYLPAFLCEVIGTAFPPRTRIRKWGMNLRLTHFMKCY